MLWQKKNRTYPKFGYDCLWKLKPSSKLNYAKENIGSTDFINLIYHIQFNSMDKIFFKMEEKWLFILHGRKCCLISLSFFQDY